MNWNVDWIVDWNVDRVCGMWNVECGTPIIIPRNLVLRDSRVLDKSFKFAYIRPPAKSRRTFAKSSAYDRKRANVMGLQPFVLHRFLS